jgi:hypothetical protein
VKTSNSDEENNLEKDRNAFVFGFTPQAELWNGRLAMVVLAAYFVWLFNGVGALFNFLYHFSPMR